MCGIAGFVGGGWNGDAETRAILARMKAGIAHRGPDHSDVWIDSENRVGFAHNRLAILDLSAAGNQPMQSHSGRFVVIYNGEIYLEVRDELASIDRAPNWAGHSDTETLLAAIDAWGVRDALERATGMFAFALWDRQERTLVLARDRLGEKPLYYGRQGGAAVSVRLRAQGDGRASAVPEGYRSRSADPSAPVQLHPGAILHLRGHPKAAGGRVPDAAGGARAGNRAILVGCERCRAWGRRSASNVGRRGGR
jgi:asparagine synthetase B (glutamine-hydrolysing)